MFKQKIYIFLLLLIGIVSSSVAQRDTTLTREVEVTKAFKPTISDANKINDMPRIEEAEHQIPKFNYSISSQPILNAFSVNALKAATIDNKQKKDTGYGLIRAGVGNYNKPYGEFFFNNLNSKKSIFGIHAKHLSSHGKIKLDGGNKVDAPFSNNEAEVYYKHDFNKTVLSVDVDYSHDGFNYYGYPEKAIPSILLEDNQQITYQGAKQAFSKGGINIGLKNPVAEIDDPVFNFNLNYHYFGAKTEQTEHFGEFKVDFQKPFDTGTLLGDVGAVFVQSDGIYNQSLNEPGKRQQTWLFAKPAYFYGGKMADIQVGFNAWFVMDADMDALAKVTPNVRVNFRPVKDVIKLYAGIDGNYINNNYSKIAYENPFVDPTHDVTNSFEKLHFYGGIDGKFSSKTNFKIGVDYSMIDDQQFYYLNEYYYPEPSANPNPLIVNNTFDVLYDNINLLKLNVEIFHTSSEKLNLLLSGNYYAYTLNEQEEAWNKPDWDATLSIDYKITEQLSVGADVYLIGGRKALILESTSQFIGSSAFNNKIIKSYNLDVAFDLNVNANYQITQKFAAFGQLNNFGFQQYQRWLGYPVQSFNALVGVSYAF
ncbi:MAG: hypothetical protein HQ522_20810 [Bacteroidetes bacterium]|nr:hypothetical protein [Bacteroidota bacterium]